MHESSFGLEWLISPITEANFLDEYWERKTLLVERNNASYFSGLPGIDDVDEIITATISGRIRGTLNDGLIVRTDRQGVLTERGIPLDANGVPDIQSIYRSYNDGYTVVVNQIHRRRASVALLSRSIERSLNHPVGVNMYLTPRNAQGFRPHVDTHDVFIVQLYGEKIWHVGTPDYELPLASAKNGRLEKIRDQRELVLRPGDILYMPRGIPHEALSSGSSSLHLTVGIHVNRVVDLCTEFLGLLAADEVDLRKSLPANFLSAPIDVESASALLQKAAEVSRNSRLWERAKEQLAAKLIDNGKAASGGQFRAIDSIAAATGDSRVSRTPGIVGKVRTSDTESIIEFSGNFVAGPLELEPSLMFIAGNSEFHIKDIPGDITTEDKVELVGRLVSEGLLRLTKDDRRLHHAE